MAKIAYVGVGSNLGNKRENCLHAMELCGGIPGCRFLARSDFFLTEPVGDRDQDWFINGAFCLSVDISAPDLLKGLLGVEESMGRKRIRPWGPRVIDLDLLLFGQDIIHEQGLEIPHPLMHLRRFVLVPLIQLAPDVVHPVLNRTVSQLLEKAPGEGQSVRPWGDS